MSQDYVRRTYADGEDIFLEGDRAGEAFLITSGNVRLHKTVNGEINEIDVVGRGQIFGEMGVISDMNRMASATAVGETVVTCCHRREMLRRIDQLNEDLRDAIRFMIVYCQDFLPYELMDNRPTDEETANRDKTAADLLGNQETRDAAAQLDPFLAGIYNVLAGYTKRRIPPNAAP